MRFLLLSFIIFSGLVFGQESAHWLSPLLEGSEVHHYSGQFRFKLPLRFPQERGPLIINSSIYLQNAQSTLIGRNLGHHFSIDYMAEKQLYVWNQKSFSRGVDGLWYSNDLAQSHRLKIENPQEIRMEDREGNFYFFSKKNDGKWWIESAQNNVNQRTQIDYVSNTTLFNKISYAFVNDVAQYEIRFLYSDDLQSVKEIQQWTREKDLLKLRTSYHFETQRLSQVDHWKKAKKNWTLSWLLNKENKIQNIWDDRGNQITLLYKENNGSVETFCHKVPGEVSTLNQAGNCTSYNFGKPLPSTDLWNDAYEEVTIQGEGKLLHKQFHPQHPDVIVLEWKSDLSHPHLKLKKEFFYEYKNFPSKKVSLVKEKIYFEDLTGKKASSKEIEYSVTGHCLQLQKTTSSTGTLVTQYKYLPNKDFQCLPILTNKKGRHFDPDLDFDYTYQWERDGKTGLVTKYFAGGKEIESFQYSSLAGAKTISWQNFKGDFKNYSYNSNGLLAQEKDNLGLEKTYVYWPTIDKIKLEQISRGDSFKQVEWDYDQNERKLKNSLDEKWSYQTPTANTPAIEKYYKDGQLKHIIYSANGRYLGETYSNESGTKVSHYRHFNPSLNETFIGQDFPLMGGDITFQKLQSWAKLSQKTYRRNGLFIPISKEISKVGDDELETNVFSLNIESGFLYATRNHQDIEVYDAHGFPLKQIAPKGKILISYHDLLGRPRKIEIDHGPKQVFSYDELDQLTSSENSLYGKFNITRGKNGLIFKKSYQLNNSSFSQTFVYDSQKRIAESIFVDEATMKNSIIRFFYDGKSCNGKFIYPNQNGLLTSFCDQTYEVSWQRNLDNELIERSTLVRGQTKIQETFLYQKKLLQKIFWSKGDLSKSVSIPYDNYQRPIKYIDSKVGDLVHFHYNEYSKLSSIDFIPLNESIRILFDHTNQIAVQAVGKSTNKWLQSTPPVLEKSLFYDDNYPRKIELNPETLLTFPITSGNSIVGLWQQENLIPIVMGPEQKSVLTLQKLTRTQEKIVFPTKNNASIWEESTLFDHLCQGHVNF